MTLSNPEVRALAKSKGYDIERMRGTWFTMAPGTSKWERHSDLKAAISFLDALPDLVDNAAEEARKLQEMSIAERDQALADKLGLNITVRGASETISPVNSENGVSESDTPVSDLIGEHCPNCPDVGWYVMEDYQGEPEQIQCEFCYTVRNSVFNMNDERLGNTARPMKGGLYKPEAGGVPGCPVWYCHSTDLVAFPDEDRLYIHCNGCKSEFPRDECIIVEEEVPVNGYSASGDILCPQCMSDNIRVGIPTEYDAICLDCDHEFPISPVDDDLIEEPYEHWEESPDE